MKTFAQIIKERPNTLTIFGLMILFLARSLILHRFLLQIFSGLMLLTVLGMVAYSHKIFPIIIYNLIVILYLVFLVSPLDLAIRNSDGWHIRWVDIWRSNSHPTSLRKATEHGHSENVDFVFYEHPGGLLGPYWAILITVPTKCKITTPF